MHLIHWINTAKQRAKPRKGALFLRKPRPLYAMLSSFHMGLRFRLQVKMVCCRMSRRKLIVVAWSFLAHERLDDIAKVVNGGRDRAHLGLKGVEFQAGYLLPFP